MKKISYALFGLVVVISFVLFLKSSEWESNGYQSYKKQWVDYGQPIHSAADMYTLDGHQYKLASKDDSSIILRGASHDGIICTYKNSVVHMPSTFTVEQLLVSNGGGEDVLKRVLLTVIVEKNNHYLGQSLVHVMVHDIGWPKPKPN